MDGRDGRAPEHGDNQEDCNCGRESMLFCKITDYSKLQLIRKRQNKS